MLMVKLKLNFERKETILKKEITEKKKNANFSSLEMEMCFSNHICQSSKNCHLLLKGK